MRMAVRCAFLAVAVLIGWLPAAAQQPAAPKVMIPPPADPNEKPALSIAEVLVIGPTGSGRRAVISPDALAPTLIDGSWRAPKAGEEVRLADGSVRQWRETKLDDKLWLKEPELRGGYAYIGVDAVADGVTILDAIGHMSVLVNGEPRVGDPYRTGMVRLPIRLNKGRNHFLLRGRSDEGVRFVLRQAMSEVDFDMTDATVPDLVEGRGGRMLAAFVVTNASEQWQRGWVLSASVPGGPKTRMEVEPLPPLSTRKIGFEFVVPEGGISDPRSARVSATLMRMDAPIQHSATANLRLRKPTETRKVTFRSGIDGSVQYYALRPAVGEGEGKEGLPLILSLHGAGVEAIGQADSYSAKDWCNLVAPTNRRPFGFDWEDWGRTDAMETLAHASALLKPDPRRVYLTGHSMGGHGTWQIGAHYPGLFAAIAPSAGWVSFWSYSGAAAYDGGTPVENILRRAASASDTLALKRNYAGVGVYVLHGDADDNVPVREAREMRGQLGEFHADFAYYERPGAGHWWGNECVDWPPLMEFLRRHERPRASDVTRVQFVTAGPGISSTLDWVTVEAPFEQMKPSSVDLRLDAQRRVFIGKTENVARLSLDLSSLGEAYTVDEGGASVERWTLRPGAPIGVELDGQTIDGVPWPEGEARVWLERSGGEWKLSAKPPAAVKGPHRAGLFKSAFGNGAVLVVGTAGTPEENAWAMAQAKCDAETFWYRGNGALRIVLDSEFDAAKEPDRNIVLYGNAYSNRAWGPLMDGSPVQVAEGMLTVGERKLAADNLACLLIRPRPGSDVACVGAVSGTGVAGMRLAARVPYFVSGVGVPDWVVIGPEAMTAGAGGVRAAGFFGNDWGLSEAATGWAEGASGEADRAP